MQQDHILLRYVSHYKEIDTDKDAPAISKGDTVLLQEIPIKDFEKLGSDFYGLLYENGILEFYAGKRVDDILWFYRVLDGKPMPVPTSAIRKLYRICAVLKPGAWKPFDKWIHNNISR